MSSTLDLDSVVDPARAASGPPRRIAASVGVSLPERVSPTPRSPRGWGSPTTGSSAAPESARGGSPGREERLRRTPPTPPGSRWSAPDATPPTSTSSSSPPPPPTSCCRTPRRWSPTPSAPTRAGAFDVGAACTGFLSALSVGSAQIEAGRARCVVVVGADFMSRITDPDDRATAAVFADGAGAVVLVATEQAGPDRTGGARRRRRRRRVTSSSSATSALIRMRGHETFREAVARLSRATLAGDRAAAGVDARRDRPVRLSPGQRAHPQRRRRAARAPPRAGRRLHRRVREHVRGDAAAGAWPTRAAQGRSAPAIGCCWAPSAPASPGARRWSSGGAA